MLTKINNIDFSDQLWRNSKIGLRSAQLHHWTHLMQKTASNFIEPFPSYSVYTHTHRQTDGQYNFCPYAKFCAFIYALRSLRSLRLIRCTAEPPME